MYPFDEFVRTGSVGLSGTVNHPLFSGYDRLFFTWCCSFTMNESSLSAIGSGHVLLVLIVIHQYFIRDLCSFFVGVCARCNWSFTK